MSCWYEKALWWLVTLKVNLRWILSPTYHGNPPFSTFIPSRLIWKKWTPSCWWRGAGRGTRAGRRRARRLPSDSAARCPRSRLRWPCRRRLCPRPGSPAAATTRTSATFPRTSSRCNLRSSRTVSTGLAVTGKTVSTAVKLSFFLLFLDRLFSSLRTVLFDFLSKVDWIYSFKVDLIIIMMRITSPTIISII